jgi:hypothetical protein
MLILQEQDKEHGDRHGYGHERGHRHVQLHGHECGHEHGHEQGIGHGQENVRSKIRMLDSRYQWQVSYNIQHNEEFRPLRSHIESSKSSLSPVLFFTDIRLSVQMRRKV